MISNCLYYFRSCRALWPYLPTRKEAFDLARFFPNWQASLTPPANSLDDATPWITFAAAEVLTNFLKQCKNPRVFEFGSGGSTLYFLNHGAELDSVEHDSGWFDAVTARVSPDTRSAWRCHLCPPIAKKNTVQTQDSACDPTAYVSSASEYEGMSFENYAKTIDAYPDHHFDLVLIDGRSRPSCFVHALNKVRSGGLLVLDNSERPHYHAIHQHLKGMKTWDRIQCSGPGPYNRYFWETTIWKRRQE